MEKQIKETTGYFYSEDLKRIADAMEEILRLVKEDMRPRKKKTQSWPTGLGKKENAKKKN
jgi:hypothetical protein